MIVLLATRSGASTLRVEPTRLTTATVTQGEFRDYYPVDGRIEPATTVYLDMQEGGRVEEIFVAGGHPIAKGELIMRLSNANLQRSAIETETRLIENLDLLRNTQLARAQESSQLKDAHARSRTPDHRDRETAMRATSASGRKAPFRQKSSSRRATTSRASRANESS